MGVGGLCQLFKWSCIYNTSKYAIITSPFIHFVQKIRLEKEGEKKTGEQIPLEEKKERGLTLNPILSSLHSAAIGLDEIDVAGRREIPPPSLSAPPPEGSSPPTSLSAPLFFPARAIPLLSFLT